MIISASRRTDLPAFYSTWFMNRIRAGYCFVPNPRYPEKISRVSLRPEDVDAIVFWSKNPRPLLSALDELSARGYTYYFQFTLNDYPKVLEPVPSLQRRLKTFHQLSSRLGPSRVVWRYDPIVITAHTGYDFHAAAFEKLVTQLRGATQRVVLSVVDLYRTVDQRLATHGLSPDPEAAQSYKMLQLLRHFAEVSKAAEIVPYSCAEDQAFSKAGVCPGSCIDAELLASLGVSASRRKDAGQRLSCHCVQSRDIGLNDTCLHNCTYCYATLNQQAAHRRHALHDPNSPIMVGQAADPGPPPTATVKRRKKSLPSGLRPLR
jgi:hypothetical protein